ncbi:hypothetical protein JL09_g5122 [Pichia kudriavzevii]|uniref:Uncharacterized protein n=1 Tax=Pichia kudriavzevii TaxID=4909 RepID=A0A099NSB6_PICKU|nr:hypothetical protein JL09_g5122 [Pichia kudriavzevii]
MVIESLTLVLSVHGNKYMYDSFELFNSHGSYMLFNLDYSMSVHSLSWFNTNLIRQKINPVYQHAY